MTPLLVIDAGLQLFNAHCAPRPRLRIGAWAGAFLLQESLRPHFRRIVLTSPGSENAEAVIRDAVCPVLKEKLRGNARCGDDDLAER
jgi:peptide subunit release factor 1 (eRF1)